MTPETLPTPKFAIGDVVQLKSGGPLMTVSNFGSRCLNLETDYGFDCGVRWFDGCQMMQDCLLESCLNPQYPTIKNDPVPTISEACPSFGPPTGYIAVRGSYMQETYGNGPPEGTCIWREDQLQWCLISETPTMKTHLKVIGYAYLPSAYFAIPKP